MEKLLVKTAIQEYKTEVIETFAKDSVKFIGRAIGEIASEGDLSSGLESVGKQLALQYVEESAVESATSTDTAKEIVAEAALEEVNTLLNVGIGIGLAVVIFSASQAYDQYNFNKDLNSQEIEEAKKEKVFQKKIYIIGIALKKLLNIQIKQN